MSDSSLDDLLQRSAADPHHLYLRVLGDVHLFWNGEALLRPGPKPLALLIYLHLRGGASRNELEEMFWPDRRARGESALQNVRQALTALRRLEGAAQWLREEEGKVTVAGRSEVSELRLLHAMGQVDAALEFVRPNALFLARLPSPSPLFDLWMEEERQNLLALQLSAVHACGLKRLEAGDYDRGRELLQRALDMEPLGEIEAIHRALMLIEFRSGNSAQALEQFEQCRQTLHRDLGLLPEEETLKLLRQIEDQQAGALQRGQLLTREGLQVETEPLLGRRHELSTLISRLHSHERVLVQALGGLGKTRLARAAAAQVVREGGQVAWLEIGADTAPVILTGLRDLLRAKAATPLEQALNEAEVRLIVLDNAASTYALSQTLAQLPQTLPVLVTSRLRLPGLSKLELAPLPREDAVALLHFHLSPTAPLDVSKQDALCALLGDHPFAVRLAARTISQSPAHPARESDVIRALYAAPQDTVRALLEQSVSDLGGREYEVYLGLGSLYAPQSTPELLAHLLQRPVEEVTEALLGLLGRGLLTLDKRAGSDTLCFRMHDLTWHSAREHRAHLPPHVWGAVANYAQAHSTVPDLLATDLPHLLGAAATAPPTTLRQLMSGWLSGQYIAARGFPTAHLHLLDKAAQEAELAADWAAASLLNGKYADISQALLGDQLGAIPRYHLAARQSAQAGQLVKHATQLALAGVLEAANGRPEAWAHLQTAQALADQAAQPFVQARVREQRAIAHAFQRQFGEARGMLVEARDLLAAQLHLGTAPEEAQALWVAYLNILSSLGQAEYRLGHVAAALELKEQVWHFASERDERLIMARAALDRGELLHKLGRAEEALSALQQAAELSQALGAGALESAARQLRHDISSAL